MAAELAPVRRRANQELVRLEVDFEVITPVFGGGVYVDPERSHHKPIDAVTHVRSAAVRGQLRFWWRASHAWSSLAEMAERERTLWGAASTHGLVSLSLDLRQTSVSEVSLANVPIYAGFPLRTTDDSPSGTLTNIRQTVRLFIDCPRIDCPPILDAIQAWLAFGGIGGRTRRGFGALAGRNLLIAGQSVPLQTVTEVYDRFRIVHCGISSLPHLGGASLAIRRGYPQADAAFRDGIQRLKAFRQDPPLARRQRPNHPGRSFWPEPDTIRRITNTNAQGHEPSHSVQSFPRAFFGMPIIFEIRGRGEPPRTTLLPIGARGRNERMTSPLIIRPFRDGNDYGCLALYLSGTRPQSQCRLVRTQTNSDICNVETQLTPAEARQIYPIQQSGAHVDPILAFLEYFQR